MAFYGDREKNVKGEIHHLKNIINNMSERLHAAEFPDYNPNLMESSKMPSEMELFSSEPEEHNKKMSRFLGSSMYGMSDELTSIFMEAEDTYRIIQEDGVDVSQIHPDGEMVVTEAAIMDAVIQNRINPVEFTDVMFSPKATEQGGVSDMQLYYWLRPQIADGVKEISGQDIATVAKLAYHRGVHVTCATSHMAKLAREEGREQ